MKYRYLYQTKDNQNKSGEITAADRAEAYTLLRKQGIRPFRVIGDDPKWWQRPHVRSAAATAAAFLVLGIALGVWAFRTHNAHKPSARMQLTGDGQLIAKSAANGWRDALELPLDRFLAAYAQPGWRLEPQRPDAAELAAFEQNLSTPLERASSDPDEIRQLKNILLKMRSDLREYLDDGGTLPDYLDFLEERRKQECELRDKAAEALERAPESMRRRALLNLNTRLRDLGLAPLPQ